MPKNRRWKMPQPCGERRERPPSGERKARCERRNRRIETKLAAGDNRYPSRYDLDQR